MGIPTQPQAWYVIEFVVDEETAIGEKETLHIDIVMDVQEYSKWGNLFLTSDTLAHEFKSTQFIAKKLWIKPVVVVDEDAGQGEVNRNFVDESQEVEELDDDDSAVTTWGIVAAFLVIICIAVCVCLCCKLSKKKKLQTQKEERIKQQQKRVTPAPVVNNDTPAASKSAVGLVANDSFQNSSNHSHHSHYSKKSNNSHHSNNSHSSHSPRSDEEKDKKDKKKSFVQTVSVPKPDSATTK